ncbi:DUF2779 domain-containing protein [Flavobacterium gawalongense]|uniref:DUF2779 domain-containing protein n=1 Tax=Flavobacterium gawalongense TaxID=2594432 RepID=UPI001183EB36|nr:DUF2779 domain-containing protein [Flavobacterium gawalongense]TRX11696.1 DUF2779 domain-containing protein [Flavobacterium gawalongense]TRX29488.1 DUF2779 domain-containing protein [Flavobacterium gawalongense]
MKLLTKSRFKIALECSNKLFYTSKKEYANNKNEDPFLKALANGGFQVEELARLHYPNGIFINTENYEYEKAAQLTQEALQNDNVVIYEAAFQFDGLFIRTDIIVKNGNIIKLIEVKAKSFNPNEENNFVGTRGGLVSSWKPYLFDLAFQKYVAQKMFPQFKFDAYLLMADKTKKASIDGLNQLFRIPNNGNPRTDIIKRVHSLKEIGNSVLSEANVDAIINEIINDKYKYYENLNFEEAITTFKKAYQEDKYLNWPTQFSACKNCEFKASSEQEEEGLLSGFKHCFTKQLNWSPSDFNKPNALQIWNFRSKNIMVENRMLMEQLTEEDFNIKTETGRIAPSERQWIQVEKAVKNDNSIYVEKEALKQEMNQWMFPLHFIDFETSTVALPFTAGRKPYEQVAFQFSHHRYNEDGTIQHQSQYINNTAGEFPNFIFARALQAAIGNDDGTVFKFATHENTIINAIITQLEESDEADKENLIAFLKTISKSTKNQVKQWEGHRNMVDLCKVVKDYYYNPYTNGSNSIKAVLPASLNSSEFLKKKYSQPIGNILLSSQNFPTNHIWLQMDGDKVINPYKTLPTLFDNWSETDLEENISDIENIADGGSALTAYAKLQYVDMTPKERNEITQGLLKYCELDTLAMVMIYEHFKFDIIEK